METIKNSVLKNSPSSKTNNYLSKLIKLQYGMPTKSKCETDLNYGMIRKNGQNQISGGQEYEMPYNLETDLNRYKHIIEVLRVKIQ